MVQNVNGVAYEDVQIFMARDNFDNLPVFRLPPGYAFRSYRTGDDLTWTEIQQVSDPFNEIDVEVFQRNYGSAAGQLPDRMWFVITAEGEAIGTISSWWEHGPEHPDDRGRIHWVAVRPDHQRRGISKPMMTQAMRHMAKHHDRAMLDTSSGRPWAVKVYLDFGFHPEPGDLADSKRLDAWRNVQSVIDHPQLRTLLFDAESRG